MAIARDDRYVTDALGRALAGAQVYWCTQPASPATNPPSPLATIYSTIAGGTPETQPVLTDGFGHAYAYMDNAVLYTVVIWHPLFGNTPVVLTDQTIGGGSAASAVTPFSGIPTGTIDGTNKVFTLVNGTTPLTAIPTQYTVWLNYPLIEGVGYSIALNAGQVQVTFANAPQPASGGNPPDSLWAQGYTI